MINMFKIHCKPKLKHPKWSIVGEEKKKKNNNNLSTNEMNGKISHTQKQIL